MLAVQIVAPGKLELLEKKRIPLKDHEARIRVVASWVCGSDLKNIMQPKHLPQVPGHEFSGIIVEVPTKHLSKIKFRTGDRVTVFPMIGCMSCKSCSERRFRDCTNRKDLGFQAAGSYAEEVVVDSRFIVPLPSELSFEQGALVEHLSCGYRLAHEINEVLPSSDTRITIIGDGPIALADLQCLKILGYQNITVVGKHPSRLALAKELGATRSLEFQQCNNRQNIDHLFPVDVCILAAPAEKTLKQIAPSIGTGGMIYPQSRVADSALLSMISERKISLGKAFAYEFDDFISVMHLMRSGKLRTDHLLGTEISLSEVPAMTRKLFEKDRSIKILIRNNLSL